MGGMLAPSAGSVRCQGEVPANCLNPHLLLEEFAGIITRAGTTTIYVTHNLTEAVRLGHQIVILSRRPGEIRDILRVDRPLAERCSADPDLAALEQRLWRMIRDDAAVAERERTDARA
jgi:NitT/TauT family transport system ATP-binding protein